MFNMKFKHIMHYITIFSSCNGPKEYKNDQSIKNTSKCHLKSVHKENSISIDYFFINYLFMNLKEIKSKKKKLEKNE